MQATPRRSMKPNAKTCPTSGSDPMSNNSQAAVTNAAAEVPPSQNTLKTGRRAILAASIGNALEWYDFSVYAFFAIYISRNVFVDSGGASALIGAFLVYGVGFIARPVGAVVLGAYADRSGRRAALTLSLFLMAAG